jgi:hypothetical protein
MGFPQAAQMTLLGFLKNMSTSPKASFVERSDAEQSACHRLGDRLRHVLLHG